MHAARQQFLAGAAFTEQQHRRVGDRHLLDRAAHAQQLRVARDQAGQHIRLLHRLQAFVLLLQFMKAVGALDRQAEHLDLEGLGKEVVGAEGDRAQRVGAVVLAGEHDDLGVRRQRQDLFEQLEAFGDRIGSGGKPRSMVTTGG
jgi:hypothetical protein